MATISPLVCITTDILPSHGMEDVWTHHGTVSIMDSLGTGYTLFQATDQNSKVDHSDKAEQCF
jgi:hypothetical protein